MIEEKKTELLTPEDKLIQERIRTRRRKIPARKIITCEFCGVININNGNSHKCKADWNKID